MDVWHRTELSVILSGGKSDRSVTAYHGHLVPALLNMPLNCESHQATSHGLLVLLPFLLVDS